MKIKALCSFSGAFTMAAGEIRECEDSYILEDLLQAGYVEEAKDVTEAVKPARKKAVKKDADQ